MHSFMELFLDHYPHHHLLVKALQELMSCTSEQNPADLAVSNENASIGIPTVSFGLIREITAVRKQILSLSPSSQKRAGRFG